MATNTVLGKVADRLKDSDGFLVSVYTTNPEVYHLNVGVADVLTDGIIIRTPDGKDHMIPRCSIVSLVIEE